MRKPRNVNRRFSSLNEASLEQRVKKLSDKLGSQWIKEELERFYEAYRKHGKDWEKVAADVGSRTVEMVEALYYWNQAYLSLPEGIASVVGLIAKMTDHSIVLEENDNERAHSDESDNERSDASNSQKPVKRKCGEMQLSVSKDSFQSPSIASTDGSLSKLKRRCVNDKVMVQKRKPRNVNTRFSSLNEASLEKDIFNSNKVDQRMKLSDKLGSQWKKEEIERFYEAYREHGKDWEKVAADVGSRTVEMVEALYNWNQAYLSLPEGTASVVGLIAKMTNHGIVLEENDSKRFHSEESDNERSDASSSQNPVKRKCGEMQLSVSKDSFQSPSIASIDGSLSKLKRRCVNDKVMVRKTKPRSVNRGFSSLNEASLEKDIFNSNKVDQQMKKLSDKLGSQWKKEEIERFYEAYRKHGNDWEKVAADVGSRSVEMVEALYNRNQEENDSERTHSDESDNERSDESSSQKPVKRKCGKMQFSVSKDYFQSPSIATNDGSVSKLKRSRINVSHAQAVGKRTPRIPVNYSYRKDEALTLTDAAKRACSPKVSQIPYKRSEQKSSAVHRLGKMAIDEENKPVIMEKHIDQNFSLAKQWKSARSLESSLASEVNLASKQRSRRKMSFLRTFKPKEKSSEIKLKWQPRTCMTSVQDKDKLSNCLSSYMVRRWCVFEWFYSPIDYPWFSKRELSEYLNLVDLGNITRLTRVEWSVIKSSLGRPRRFCERFLREERQKLEQYRRSVREYYTEIRAGVRDGLPTDLPKPFYVGQLVIALNSKTGEIHNGIVLTVDHDKCMVQFDHPGLGVEFFMDIDCMPLNPFDNMPETLKMQIGAGKVPCMSEEPQMKDSCFRGHISCASTQTVKKEKLPMELQNANNDTVENPK